MPIPPALKALRLALALSLPALGATPLFLPAAAHAAPLPSPYVSRALDAVLLPINRDTIAAFGLAATEKGVLVLATQPGGIADTAGILPGDVISTVRGKPVNDPISLDEIVYYWLSQNAYDFFFDGWRAGSAHNSNATITMDSWIEVIEITTVASWTAYSSESFSYSEFYSEYSEEITSSYTESETTIETAASSEDFTAEMSADEAAAIDDPAMSDDEATSDETASDDSAAADEQPVEDETMDSAPDDSGDEALPEAGGDDVAPDDNGGEEAMDDAGGDDVGADDGGDDSGSEEIIVEEE